MFFCQQKVFFQFQFFYYFKPGVVGTGRVSYKMRGRDWLSAVAFLIWGANEGAAHAYAFQDLLQAPC